MTIDTDATSANTGTSDAAQDTGSAGPVSTDTQATSTPAAEGANAETAPVDATDTQANASESLTSPKSDTTSQAAQAQPQIPWEKRYSDLRREEQRLRQQLKQFQQTYQGVDPNTVRTFQEREALAQREKLQPWNKQSPKHATFLKTLDKVQLYQAALNKAAPEKRQDVADQWAGLISEQEFNDVRAWQEHQRQEQLAMMADPRAYYAQQVRDIIREEMQQHQTASKAEQEVGGWFNDPANQPIVQQYGPQMQEMLESGAPWKFVQQHIALLAQMDGMQGRVGEAEKVKTAAEERNRLLKSQASVSRDPNTARKIDPMQVAKERGIQPGSPDYWDLLTELKSEGML